MECPRFDSVDSFLYQFDEQQQRERKKLLEQTLAEERRLGAEGRRLAEAKAASFTRISDEHLRRLEGRFPPHHPDAIARKPVPAPTKQAPKLNRNLLLL